MELICTYVQYHLPTCCASHSTDWWTTDYFYLTSMTLVSQCAWVRECAYGYLKLDNYVRLWYGSDCYRLSSPATHCHTIEIEYYCTGDESSNSTFKLRNRWLSWLPIFAAIHVSACILCYAVYCLLFHPMSSSNHGNFKVCNVKSATSHITHTELPRAGHTHMS